MSQVVHGDEQPTANWICFDFARANLPRYWRLLGDYQPPIERQVLLYEGEGSGSSEIPGQEDAPEGYLCRVDYVKDGVKKALWYARSDPSFCRRKSEDLVKRLTAGGLACFKVEPSDRVQP